MNHHQQCFNLFFLVLLAFIAAVSAFVPSSHSERTSFLTTTTSSSSSRSSPATSSSSSLCVVWDPKNNADHNIMDGNNNNEDEEPLVEFPTPAQRLALKKEASKRQARKKLPLFALPSSDQLGSFSDETLKQIWELLQEHELVQIKGFALETREKKLVYNLAMQLCSQLEWEQERQINDDVSLPVAMLSYKGHSAILYSPTLDNDHPKKFILRTSVGQKNTWTARIKAPRDHRGQIIQE